MRTSSQIALNQLTSWGTSVTQAIVAFLMVPFLLNSLGKEGYGLATLLGALVSLSSIADFGIRTALGRHLAEQIATENHQRFNELLSSAFLVAVITGAVTGVLCVVLAPTLAEAFKLSSSLTTEARLLIRWYGGVAVPLSFVVPVYSAALSAHGRFDLLNGVSAGITMLNGLALLAVLGLTTLGLRGWVIVTLGESIIRLLVLRHLVYRFSPFARTVRQFVRKDALLDLFSLGSYTFALQLAQSFSLTADPFVLATILGPSAVAIYRVGTALPSRMEPLVNIAAQLHPFATAYYVTEQRTRLHETLIRGTRYTMLLGILPCVVLGVFAEPITRYWLSGSLGPDYRVAAQVLVGWVIVEFLGYAAGAQWPILLAMKKLRFLVWSQLPFAVLNLIVSVFLVGRTSLGVIGVVIATIVIALIRRPIIIVHTARACGLPVRVYVSSAYLRPLTVLVILGGLAAALLLLGVAESILGLLASILGIAVAWLPLCWWVGCTEDDRRSLRDLARRSVTALGRSVGDPRASGERVAPLPSPVPPDCHGTTEEKS
jgi:O-antigen/teichoic acid export membrane protein